MNETKTKNEDDVDTDTDTNSDIDYSDFIIDQYDPEILVIQDPDDEYWVFNVNLYQDENERVFRIKAQTKHQVKEDAIMDANGVIELLGFNASTKIKISCLRIVDEELVDEPVWFDGLDFYPVEEGDEDADDI